jgi:DNA-binding transcriptional ArsR family regulator
MSDESPFRAIAHPARRRMLDLLRERERTVADLFSAFRLSRQAFSQHLRVLRTAGLVSQRRQGRGRVYWLQPTGLNAIKQWIESYRRVLK